MHELNQKVTELADRIGKIKDSFNLDSKKKKLSEFESKALDPNLWDDQAEARKILQDLDILKKDIGELQGLVDEIETLSSFSDEGNLAAEFEKDIIEFEKRVEKFELKSFLSEIYDTKNAMVSIHAGQGGTEAMDWASMLFRMYLRFCEKRGWKTDTIDVTEGEEAGIKSITFRVEGEYAYGYLKGEAGTHRLVRQSPFNADKLRQTSFALVEVLPELGAKDLPHIELKEDDLEWQFFRSSSQGGQNVQKVSTAVRLIHKPTNLVVTAQNERFQERNRKNALDLLRAKLWAREELMRKNQVEELKGSYRPASWGNQIRSYVLHPYKMVKDLRTEVETANAEAVLDGELDEFIEAEVRKL